MLFYFNCLFICLFAATMISPLPPFEFKRVPSQAISEATSFSTSSWIWIQLLSLCSTSRHQHFPAKPTPTPCLLSSSYTRLNFHFPLARGFSPAPPSPHPSTSSQAFVHSSQLCLLFWSLNTLTFLSCSLLASLNSSTHPHFLSQINSAPSSPSITLCRKSTTIIKSSILPPFTASHIILPINQSPSSSSSLSAQLHLLPQTSQPPFSISNLPLSVTILYKFPSLHHHKHFQSHSLSFPAISIQSSNSKSV